MSKVVEVGNWGRPKAIVHNEERNKEALMIKTIRYITRKKNQKTVVRNPMIDNQVPVINYQFGACIL